MHAILHPDCYKRLLGALRLDPAERRIEIPRFRVARESDESGSGGDRGHPPPLAEEELAAVGAQLSGEAARRRSFSAGLLRIVVDGVERARLDPAGNRTVRIGVEPGANLLEVLGRSPEGDLRLATLLLSEDDRVENRTERLSINLEGGQRLAFHCQRQTSSAGEALGLTVDVSYQETSPARAAALWVRRIFASPASPRSLGVRPELAFALLLLAAAGLFLYSESRRIGRRPPAPPQAAQVPVAPAPVSDSEGARPSAAGPREEPRLPAEILAQERPHPPASARSRERVPSETIETRGLEARPHSVSLREVRNILVEGRDDQVRSGLIQKLQATGQFQVVASPESADALLRISESKPHAAAGAPFRVAVHLIGADGKTLWPSSKAGPSGRYAGSAEEIATASVRDLLEAIHAPTPTK
jgi:hypothetical protein